MGVTIAGPGRRICCPMRAGRHRYRFELQRSMRRGKRPAQRGGGPAAHPMVHCGATPESHTSLTAAVPSPSPAWQTPEVVETGLTAVDEEPSRPDAAGETVA